jgi:uncharacterized membrane protein YhiD involved in acid resistance
MERGLQDQHTERRSPATGTAGAAQEGPRPARPARPVPFFRFLLFYAALVAIGAVLSYLSPLVRDAWITSAVVGPGQTAEGLLSGRAATTGILHEAIPDRALITLLITLGALALSLPVAWVYTFTRRLRYDPSLVHSVIILPVVVSGIVTVVQHSVALAFSLAGIVAAVRFRNTLKDPKDAVYIFLALGIGIATGVGAADIALVLSLIFNLIVLILWKYNLGAIYSGESSHSLLSIGDESLLLARTNAQRDAIRWRVSREAGDMETDGILLVHTDDKESAQRAVELTLSSEADNWKMIEDFRRRNGVSTFAVLLHLDKKGDPLTLLGELDDRWSAQVGAAEYIPYQHSAEPKKP